MPFAPMADAGGVEIEIVDIRTAAGSEQKVRAFDRFLTIRNGIVGFGDNDLDARQHAAHLGDLHSGAQPHSFAGKRIEHDLRTFAILALERRRRFQHGDVGAETAKSLRQFEADPVRRR